MTLQDLDIKFQQIAVNEALGKQNKAPVFLVHRDDDRKIITATAACAGYTRNSIKFPDTEQNREKAEILQKQLNKHTPVVIQLVNPVVKPYAMISNGNLISGISIKADSFEICSNDSDNLFAD